MMISMSGWIVEDNLHDRMDRMCAAKRRKTGIVKLKVALTKSCYLHAKVAKLNL